MGKSGHKKKKEKKGGASQNQATATTEAEKKTSPVVAYGGVNLVSSGVLENAHAHELLEEGNKMFNAKQYVSALHQYENAIRLAPETSPDRSTLHNNKAACLMLIEPIDYKTVISECTLAQHLQPHFIDNQLRRALAFEGLGLCGRAMSDVETVLHINPNHPEALVFARRLGKTLMTRQQEAPQSGPDNENPLPEVIRNLKPADNQKKQLICAPPQEAPIKYRPLKLVYDHDKRFAQMPANSSFKILRAVVAKLFPMLKAVLIKYKDSDGDLVTITCSSELRLAESSVDNSSNIVSKEPDIDEKWDSTFSTLRLHIVEVNPEQEPPSLEDEVEDKPECKELEMDDWLFDFAQIFRTHIEIDQDSHIDLHKVGMELLSKALVDTVTSEEAQNPFNKAASKFKEVAALAFLNWGNIHMCAAQETMPVVEVGPKETMDAQLKNAYDWARDKYKKAKRKYKKALLIKPDFYEALLALGQQQLQMAKLHWWFVFQSESSKGDPTKIVRLLYSAKMKIGAAIKMWKKKMLANESKWMKQQGETGQVELRPEVMSSHIPSFVGDLLFIESKLEYLSPEEMFEQEKVMIYHLQVLESDVHDLMCQMQILDCPKHVCK